MRVAKWFCAMLGCLLAFGVTWWLWEEKHFPPTGPNRLSVALAVAAAISTVIGGPLFWWAGRDRANLQYGHRPDGLSPDGWLDDLKKKMRSIWIDEALYNSLEAVATIELGFMERAEAVAVPMRQRRQFQEDTKFPKGTRLSSIFNSDGAERRLLLLGQPGAGKTTQLLHLADEMLTATATSEVAAVPVYLSLSESEWRDITIRRTEKLAPAIQWITEQVSKKYQVPQRRVISWLESDPCPIVLLLDGLDEIQSIDQRQKCVRALSQVRTVTHAGMVVSCRTNDYRDIGEVLNFGTAVDILPIATADIEEYLASANADLESLRQGVQNDEMLATLLNTPLMLCVAAMAYRDREVENRLLTGSLADRRDHLWSAYVAAMVSRRRNPQEEHTGNRRFAPGKTVDYLKFLAKAMDSENVLEFSTSYIRSTWLPAPWRQILWAMTGLRAVAVSALAGWVIWSFSASREGAIVAIIAIFFCSISVGTGLVVLVTNGLDLEVSDWRWSWEFAVRTICSAGIAGMIIGAIMGIFGGKSAVLFGCTWGLTGGFCLASILAWRPFQARANTRRRYSVIKIFLARMLTLGFFLAVGVYLVTVIRGRDIGYISKGADVATFACAGFAVVAFVFSLELIMDHYSSRLVCGYRGFTPLRLGEFLVHADERILLRRVGIYYRFLHLTLRDHLAGKPPTRSSPPRGTTMSTTQPNTPGTGPGAPLSDWPQQPPLYTK